MTGGSVAFALLIKNERCADKTHNHNRLKKGVLRHQIFCVDTTRGRRKAQVGASGMVSGTRSVGRSVSGAVSEEGGGGVRDSFSSLGVSHCPLIKQWDMV